MSEKIIVAMSGGVDSSVTAALLHQQGFQVEGVFMKNWSPESIQSLTDCPWEQDQADAAAVCAKLSIPFRSINFEREYKERVVNYFLSEYAAGRTPNPDVMCNKEIKFHAFMDAARMAGADRIATGHYARVWKDGDIYRLGRGKDSGKDQSYFLYTLSQEQLSHSLFPLGDLNKSRVRELAHEFGLPTASKKDSQGICFIGHLDVKKFLLEQLTAQPGATYLLPPYQSSQQWGERLKNSVKIGEHLGAMFYTIGERAGSIVDNGAYRKARENRDVPALYVLDKKAEDNAVYVTDSSDDVDFYSTCVSLGNWHGEDVPSDPLAWAGCEVQVRYGQKETNHLISIMSHNNIVTIETGNSPAMKSVAAGQSLVVYSMDGTVRGGGVIESGMRIPRS
jgi:tRNA-specific 2-thiouridylase